MNIFLIMVGFVLLLGGGFYFGGPVIGGSVLGLLLLTCLVLWVIDGIFSKPR